MVMVVGGDGGVLVMIRAHDTVQVACGTITFAT